MGEDEDPKEEPESVTLEIQDSVLGQKLEYTEEEPDGEASS